jgi:small GTP-binding protein
MSLTVKVLHKSPIETLTSVIPEFAFLEHFDVPRHSQFRWSMNGKEAYCAQLMFIGKTGYGKSTTLNRICGQDLFETDDMASCTKTLYSLEYRIDDDSYFSLCDLPGIGESNETDKQYKEWYTKMLEKSSCVVYVLRADSRDFSLDLDIFKSILRERKQSVIIALNYADKIEPFSRPTGSFMPSRQQKVNIDRKIQIVSELFDVPSPRIICYSAVEGYGFRELIQVTSAVMRQEISSSLMNWVKNCF